MRLSRVRLAIALASLLASAEPAAAAEAEACGSTERPWVEVSVRGARPEFAREMLSDLRAGLASSKIDVCEAAASGGSRALARVEIEAGAAEPLAFVIEVTDSVTLKRVARNVNLGELPPDGRALALALATDELLRATWAELALRGTRKPGTAAPPEVRAVVEPRAAGGVPYNAAGARFSFEHYGGGQTHYGGDAFFVHSIAGWLGLELSVGARKGLTVSAPHGTISGSAVTVGLGLAPALIRLTDFEIAALLALQGARVHFDAAAGGRATSRSASGYALYARGGFAFALGSPDSLRSHTRLGAGVPLSTFSAADAGRATTGVSALEIFATTGISLAF